MKDFCDLKKIHNLNKSDKISLIWGEKETQIGIVSCEQLETAINDALNCQKRDENFLWDIEPDAPFNFQK